MAKQRGGGSSQGDQAGAGQKVGGNPAGWGGGVEGGGREGSQNPWEEKMTWTFD